MNEKTVHKFTYGLFVLTTQKDDSYNGCIINTAIQVTTNPNQISITVNKQNYTEELIRKCNKFNLSFISEDASFSLFERFGFKSGRDVDKFADMPKEDFKLSGNGIPYITNGTNAYISAWVTDTIDLGTHTMFIATVTDMDVLSDVASASYAYYHANIKPKPQAVKSEGKVWICKICGYVYDDSKENIPFEELPDDWVCPLCKHPKSDFELQKA